jgi:long-chain acyl-CoA synthetase
MLLTGFLEKSAAKNPDKVALVCNDQRKTYHEVLEEANALAASLCANGFSSHDRAIIYLDNSVEAVISICAVLKAGGVFVVVSPQVKIKKLSFIINDSGATAIITSNSNGNALSELLPNTPSLKTAVFTGTFDSTQSGKGNRITCLNYSIEIEKRFPLCHGFGVIDVDLASLIYTSGSSGNPKGVMLSHGNMVSAVRSITEYLKNTEQDIIIDALPLAFDYGLYQVLMSFFFGGTVVLARGFTYPQQIIDLIVNEKVTGWPMVPTMVAILLQLNNLGAVDFTSLRYITSTGQVLPPEHIMRLSALFHGVKIYSMYGLTECKRVSYLDPEKLVTKPNSVGKAMPNVEAYLVDAQGDEIKAVDIPGELVVRGANVMQGYWNMPEETQKSLRPGRYPGDRALYTGDLFKKDQDGDLYFLGRKDDIIKTGGFMVSPKEVENVLHEIQNVIAAAVIGIEDELLGKALKAFVQVKDTNSLSTSDVISYCAARLEQYAVPKHVVICTQLPVTDTGKIQKRSLE